MGLEFFPEARGELNETTRFYEARTHGLGARLRSEVESVCAAIIRQPLLWRERRGGYRRVNLPGFPFYLAYIVRGDVILIVAVGHASRHPEYWHRRLS